jgi:hypothetical protein
MHTYESSLVAAGVKICVSSGSAMAAGFERTSASSTDIRVPSSVFFPPLAATLCITRIRGSAFQSTLIRWVTIPRYAQMLCSECFSYCESLSLIPFQSDSELTHIESKSFYHCSPLKSITSPRNVGFINASPFSGILHISIPIDPETSYFVVKSFFVLDSSM